MHGPVGAVHFFVLHKKMKLNILLSIITLLASLNCFASEEMEVEFIERFEGFIQAGDFSDQKLNSVWLFQDTPLKEFNQTLDNLKRTQKLGIGKLGYRKIYARVLEDMAGPIEIEGKEYFTNLQPYKMLEIEYSKKVGPDNISRSGWGYVLGEVDGKLYMVGLRIAEQVAQ